MENTKQASIEIWIGNLAEYVSGKLSGKWISLPQSTKELDKIMKRISRNGADEIMIMDYSVKDDCCFMNNVIGEWDNVQELNAVASLLGEEEHPAVEALVNSKGNMKLSEIANALMQEEEIPFCVYEFEGSDDSEVMSQLSIEEKMGYTLIESNPETKKMLEDIMIGDVSAMSYINVEAVGRDYIFNYADAYENGYLAVSERDIDLSYYSMEEIIEELKEEDMESEVSEKIQEVQPIEKSIKQPTSDRAPKL